MTAAIIRLLVGGVFLVGVVATSVGFYGWGYRDGTRNAEREIKNSIIEGKSMYWTGVCWQPKTVPERSCFK